MKFQTRTVLSWAVAGVLLASAASAEQVEIVSFADLPIRHGSFANEYWYGYHDGDSQFIIATDEDGAVSFPLASGPGPLTVEMRVEVLSAGEGGGIGLYCCGSDTDGTRLSFILEGDGVKIWERSADGTSRQSMSFGTEVGAAEGEVALTMIDGTEGFSIFINGDSVASLSDSRFPKGEVGIFFRSPGVFAIHDVSVSYSEDDDAKGLDGAVRSLVNDLAVD